MDEQNQFPPQPNQEPLNQPQPINSQPLQAPAPLAPSSFSQPLPPVGGMPQQTPQVPPVPQSTEQTPTQFSSINTFQSTQPAPGPIAPGPQPFVAQSMSQMQQGGKSGRKGKMKFVLAGLAAFLLIGGGSAAAYFGVVVPNKPENVLKAAMRNTLQQQYVNATGEVEGKDGDSPAYKMAMTVQSDMSAKAMSADMKFTMAGITVPMEARFVDKTAYIKPGDLSGLKVAFPDYAPVIDAVGKSISNQWMEIDSTILAEGGVDCALDADLKLSEEDFAIIDAAYEKNPFATIVSTSDGSVKDRPAIKYVINLDGAKGDEFAKGLKDMPIVKKFESCDGGAGASGAIDQEKKVVAEKPVSDTGITTLNLWVDKETKLVTQVEADLSDKSRNASSKAKLVMDYAKVSVTKPEGSKPITNYLVELGAALQGGPVLGAQIEQYIPGLTEEL